MSTEPVRPRQATVAAWLIMGGSLFVVLTIFERVAGLTSLETRQAVEEFVASPPGEGLGMDTEGVLDLLRVLSMVAGACAAASAILGYQVLKRSRSARLVLSVLAVPLFLTGLAAGGFMSSVVAAAVAMLWMQPTRAWFDGTTPPERPAARSSAPRQDVDERRAVPAPDAGAPRPSGGSDPADQGPRAWQGFGSPGAGAGAGAGAPGSATDVVPAPSAGHPASGPGAGGSAAGRRPAGLVWACALTWTATGLAAAGALMSVLVMLVAPEFVLDQLRANPDLADAGLSDDGVRTTVLVTGAAVVLWSLLAAVLAGLVWRGVAWARIALVVSALLAALFCVVSVLTNPLMVLPFAAAVATVVLLNRADVKAFCTRR
ncbi:hypothetical protein [Nocardioides sp. SYSU DS0663]|uniref:hypothetical protein n=1 Tax=Nocardioides sp. SYSU DS0663 TaxID=3416445 RepID=UPI003F4C006D